MNPQNITEVLRGMKIPAECCDVQQHGSFIFYDLLPQPSFKVSKVRSLLTEIGLALKCCPPIIVPLPLEGKVRLQVPSGQPKYIDFYSSYTAPNEGYLPFYLGEDPEGNAVETDMSENPHMICAGSTGSGKSIALHTLIGNAIYRGLDLYLSDPKGVEFSAYQELKNCIRYTNQYNKTVEIVEELIGDMEDRYSMMSRMGIQSIKETGFIKPKMLIIDEVADLIAIDEKKRLEGLLGRLVQKSRAAGIFCILATQRPSVGVINGLIKANFPARLVCRVSNRVDSQVVLDQQGAEHLIGKGDAILKNHEHSFTRLQIAYCDAKKNLEMAG